MPKLKRTVIPALTPEDLERFWSKVDRRGDDGCWPWLAGCDGKGYGTFGIGPLVFRAPRISYFLATGKQPYNTLHTCDNPPCVQPKHLFDGTHLDNMRDCIAKGRRRVAAGDAHWLRKHPELTQGDLNYAAKLTNAEVLEIVKIRATGASTKSIAADFGVCHSTVKFILCGRQWGSVTGIRHVEKKPKLTEEDVRDILFRVRNGEAYKTIASDFNVSDSMVGFIVIGKRYRRVIV